MEEVRRWQWGEGAISCCCLSHPRLSHHVNQKVTSIKVVYLLFSDFYGPFSQENIESNYLRVHITCILGLVFINECLHGAGLVVFHVVDVSGVKW